MRHLARLSVSSGGRSLENIDRRGRFSGGCIVDVEGHQKREAQRVRPGWWNVEDCRIVWFVCSREGVERYNLSDGDFIENAISLIMKRKYSAVEVASRVAGNPPGDKRSSPAGIRIRQSYSLPTETTSTFPTSVLESLTMAT